MKKIAVVLVLGLVFLWFRGMELFVTHSPWFELKDLRILGNENMSQDEALKLAGLRLKQNVFDLDLKSAEKRIEKDRRVRTVEICRVLPGGIELRIEEKKPDLILNLLPRLCGLSLDGEIIPLKEGRSYDLPLVNGIKSGGFAPYSRVQDPRIEEALTFYQAVREKLPEFLQEISEINLEDKDNLVVTMVKSGARLFFGAGDFRKKIERFALLNKALAVDECSCLDFRFKDQVIFKGVKRSF